MKFLSPILISLTAVFNSVNGWELGKVTISGNEFVQCNSNKHGTSTDKRYFNLADDESIFRRLHSMKLNEKTELGRIHCEKTIVYDKSGNSKFTSKILIFGDQDDPDESCVKGPRNIGRANPPPPYGDKTFDIGDYFTIFLNDTLYPILDYQDYSIEEPVVELLDSEGSGYFTIDLAYPVGAFADNIKVALYNKTCGEEVSADEQAIALGSKTEHFNYSHTFERYVQQVRINSKYFSESDLLTWGGFGESSGTLAFCAKAETLLGSSNVSVAFVKSDISMSFNLTDNTFNVFENKISSNDIITSEQNITTEYGVLACTCTDSSDCDTSQDIIFKQNGLINVCVYPDSKSLPSTTISNFNMKFVQNGEDVFTAVTMKPGGPTSTTSLSNIGGTSDRYRVASRLITTLFEGGKTSFNITGNVFLTFKTLRHLKTMQSSNLRSMQEASIGKDAGKSQFQMSVKIVKDSKVSPRESNTMGGVVVSIVGGFIALSIVFVLFKKMKK